MGKVEILTLVVGFRCFWENENDGEGERDFSLLSPPLSLIRPQLLDVLESSIFYASINTHAP